jgi:hypothetical protein
MRKIWSLITNRGKTSFTIATTLMLMLLTAVGSTASAAVLDFEDLYPGYEANGQIPTGYQGFSWNDYSYWVTKNILVQNPAAPGFYNGTNDRVSLFTAGDKYAKAYDVSLSVFPDGVFDFSGAYITQAWKETAQGNEIGPVQVVVEGWRDGSMEYTETITTSYNGAYWFNFSFTNIDTLWFRPLGGHIVIDDITFGSPIIEDIVCELKVDEDDLDEQRVAKSLHFKTYNTDPDLLDTWNSLFGVTPGEYSFITLLNDRVVTWEAGTLEMGGVMKIKVKTDKKNPALKEVKIEKAGKKEGTTEFVSGTGGVNPNMADGGWHEVKIKNMDSITVTFDGYTVTGFLKELKVKLDKESTTDDPLVKDFKLKIKGATSAPDVKKGTVTSVVIDVPETVITALGGTEYEEKIKDGPEVLSGHTKAEFKREKDAGTEGVDISSLLDGFNDELKERKGACIVED